MATQPIRLSSPKPTSTAVKWRSKLIRFTQWEYWPTKLVYAPVLFYYLFCALKARALVFVSAVNPSMDVGGLFGERKIPIIKALPDKLKPKTVYPEPLSSLDEIKELMLRQGLNYPVICKPDVGERGLLVEKVNNDDELKVYIQSTRGVRYMVQEFVAFPIELGVFYYRFPDADKGHISSIIIKEFLTVTGNGTSTIEQLLLQNDRAVLQIAKLQAKLGEKLQVVPAKGEQVLLEPIGNHSRGTKFVDGNYLINEALIRVFDVINQTTPDIYYGRYDIKCHSIEALYRGEGITILEINGAAAEPGHIYDPACSIFTAWRVLLQHWAVVYKIARFNHSRGVAYESIPSTYRKWKAYLEYYKQVNQ